jgi:hypothetical protein
VTVRAVRPVVSAEDFANRGRAYPLRMTQRHEQPVADERQSENIAEYEREDYQTLALLEVRILPDSVSGQAGELSGYGSRCRCRWLARPPHSRGVRRIGVALPVMVFPSPAVALWLWRFGLLCRRMDVG